MQKNKGLETFKMSQNPYFMRITGLEPARSPTRT